MIKKIKYPENYMNIIFTHNPKYDWKEKANTVIIDMVNAGFYHKVAQKFFHRPKISHISLDKYGSVIWKSIDGHNTVYDILNIMNMNFPKETKRMSDRTITFLRTLQINNFIIIQH